jgi:pimeloyl-ACP methyl ester carboxylesterase
MQTSDISHALTETVSMSGPTLLLLHGVSHAQPRLGHRWSWPGIIEDSMRRSGIDAEIDRGLIAAPDYQNLQSRPKVLTTSLSSRPNPRTAKPVATPVRTAERIHIESRLGPNTPRGRSPVGPFMALGGGVRMAEKHIFDGRWWAQLSNFVESEKVRDKVVRHVLDETPTEGDIVIVAHSLGTMVAIELLPHLPVNVSVRRLVTIGSPAGHPTFNALYPPSDLRVRSHFTASWINFWGSGDGACGGRGISDRFPGVVDLRVEMPLGRHDPEDYFRDPRVGWAVGDALVRQSE